jgi:hypothetical protein
MAKIRPLEEPQKSAFGFDGEMIVLALPVKTYREIEAIAAKRGQTFAEALQEAIKEYAKDK